ncbi:ATP-binding protein [Rubrivivax gelatinosus]|uniref:Sensory/regulatory protein RpfC n=2 Tax=Rubrivivax gelatinosus TaxID=28068 RepID=I0HP18_RUBGI|nr:ATP-binding protein [Rubrivivax gelatinosus]MBG6081363.1 signal transduction histidine kinase/CheY-like chemotaxis protein [Rubrivivax gelatinosus]BAL94755.1 sensor protein [Rubrivivax gelatinosus IL144]
MPNARRSRATWLGVLGVGLIFALLAVAWLQVRQAALLRQAVEVADDDAVLLVYQAETEYLRLRDEWSRSIDPRRVLDTSALQLRYDIWISRVGLLHNERIARILADETEFADTLMRMDRFIRRADEVFGTSGGQGPARDALLELEPELMALGQEIHGLSMRAAHHVGEQVAARNATVQHHNMIGIGLTVSLSALTLAFALLALRQMRQLDRRRAALEELAEHLRQARRDAEAASEAKSAFLANMSHEIRTPFHGLLGMLSLLRETGLNQQQVGYLRTATESADHLLAILNDILDMSQLESGRMVLNSTPVELRALLRDVEALMRPQAHAKSLALHIVADPALPERVLCDATRVKQVLFNLLSNAIKFSDRGAVVLDVQAHDAVAVPELVFTVTDQGIGIDEATLATLFHRFVQGDSSRSRRHGGTGLGLEISRNLARLMGGDITVTSQPGSGSSFRFRMPLKPVAAGAAPHPLPGDAPPPPRPLRVLVAEDHFVNRQYMAALLERLGHTAVFAANGHEAVDAMHAAGTRPFDIVLMDLHMPEMDGIAATRAIRALPDPTAATVPIVALTADAFTETRDRCLVAGMNDFLTKPVSPQKLAASLRRFFGSTGGAEFPPVSASAAPAAPAAGAGDSPPLIDPAAIELALQAMPRERLAAMVHSFLDQGPQLVQRLRAAVRDAQPLELRVNAHAARGAALNLGLAALAATADALQEGATHLPAHEIARHVQRFEDLLPATRDAAIAAGLAQPANAAA